MQIHQSQYRSVYDCARTVYRNEGLTAFYVSYPTTLMMTIPFTAVQFTVYEQCKKMLNPTNVYSPVTHVVAGGVAGAVGAAVTTPLDVAKTLLQTRGTSHDHEIRTCRGMIHAFRLIWQKDGLRGFGRGLSPRILTHMPSNALSWLSYEFFSKFFSLSFVRTETDHLFLQRQRSDKADFIRSQALGRPTYSLYLAFVALIGYSSINSSPLFHTMTVGSTHTQSSR